MSANKDETVLQSPFLTKPILKEFYIYGRPIETIVGNLHFITVGEYYDFITEGYLSALLTEKADIIKHIKPVAELNPSAQTVLDILLQANLFDFMQEVDRLANSEEFDIENSYINILGIVDLYTHLKDMFTFCFKTDVFCNISSQEEFDFYKDLIIEINCISYEKPNPNPEIERFNQMKRLIQKSKGEGIDWESMYTSVGLTIGKDPDQMTLYKFHKYFARLVHFKNYDSSVLFATVSSDAKIEPWYKPIEKIEEEVQTISAEQLKSGNTDGLLESMLTKNKHEEE